MMPLQLVAGGFTPELFERYIHARFGTGDPVYWYAIGDSTTFSRPYGTGHLPRTAPLPALKCWAIFGRPYGTASLTSHHCAVRRIHDNIILSRAERGAARTTTHIER